MGRLVRHAARPADRVVALVSHGNRPGRSYVVLNTFIVGILVFGLAQLSYIALQRWEEVAEIMLGLWLIASPYIFGYFDDGLLRFWHSSLGGLVVLLAALQLWQDWDLSDQEMLKHGQ
jgi:hypothetical protein